MILVDSNLLVYAGIRVFEQHVVAKSWLDKRLNGAAPVGIPWQSMMSFLRIVTNARILSPPVSPEAAWRSIEYWLDCPTVWIPCPTERHRDVLAGLVKETSPVGNLVPDAHLAALAIEQGLLLCSTDRDFSRFPGLNWQNPLSEGA